MLSSRVVGLGFVIFIIVFVLLMLARCGDSPGETVEPQTSISEVDTQGEHTPQSGIIPVHPATLTPTATATSILSPTIIITATPTDTATLTPTPTDPYTPQPLATETLPPTATRVPGTPKAPMPPLPPGNVCVEDIQVIYSPTNGYEYSDDRTFIELYGSVAWPADREGQFLKYEVFYYDPDNQKHDLAEVRTPVSGGLLHRQAFGPLVHQYGDPGWFTFGVLGIRTDSNHFPLGTTNEGCFVRVYLPWPR